MSEGGREGVREGIGCEGGRGGLQSRHSIINAVPSINSSEWQSEKTCTGL